MFTKKSKFGQEVRKHSTFSIKHVNLFEHMKLSGEFLLPRKVTSNFIRFSRWYKSRHSTA